MNKDNPDRKAIIVLANKLFNTITENASKQNQKYSIHDLSIIVQALDELVQPFASNLSSLEAKKYSETVNEQFLNLISYKKKTVH